MFENSLMVRKTVDIIYLKREKSRCFMLYSKKNLVLIQKACGLAKAFTSLRYKTSVKTKVKTQMRLCTRISRPRFLQEYQKDNFYH